MGWSRRTTILQNLYVLTPSLFDFVCSSNTYALKSKRKTLVPNDVFSALEDMEFESFIPELKESLEGNVLPPSFSCVCVCVCACVWVWVLWLWVWVYVCLLKCTNVDFTLVYKEEQKSKLADRKRKLEEKSEESQQKRPTEEVVTPPKESDKEQDDVGDAEVVEGATLLSSTHQSSADVDTMSTEHRQDS